MIRFFPLILALLSFAPTSDAAQASLHSVLKERLQATGDLPKMDEERTWAANGFIPLQSIEVMYGYGDIERDEFYKYNPISRKYNDSIRFRLNIKSVKEMTTFFESRSVSRELMDLEKQEVLNQRQYDAYLEIVSQLLQARMLKMLGAREAQLQKSLTNGGQIMALAKADSKDLVRELERLQKVSVENEGLKAQDASLVSSMDVEASSRSLVDGVGRLAQKVASLGDSLQPLSVKHNSLEVRLQRIDKEVSWANDRKIFDHIDFQRNNLDKEDAVRISFNIPFIRFDNESRARDRAFLAVKEAGATRKSEALNAELKRARSALFGLAAQVESLKQRLAKAREIESKVRRVKDVELRSVLRDYRFELERDVLTQSLKFYAACLEYLRDIGAFARMANRNLLDPEFKEFG